MKTQHLLLIGAMALCLSACGTVHGLKQDIGSLGGAVGSTVNDLKTKATTASENHAPAVINDGTCPPIFVDPQLSSISEFYNMEKPSKGTEVSSMEITETASACQVDGEYLEVKVQLSFAGKLGPKAKRKSGDRPFFAYPYFIAVTDDQNTELAKELFAASVTYESKQEKIELVETIRQKLPLNDDGSTPPYQVKIGFQLTEEQLFYNASR